MVFESYQQIKVYLTQKIIERPYYLKYEKNKSKGKHVDHIYSL